MLTKKRGLSPIIATTILIALVIVIALLVFFWFRSTFNEQVTKFGQEVSLTCEEVSFDAEYRVVGTDGILTVSNKGNVPIYQVNVKIEKGAIGAETKNINEISTGWPSTGLNQEDIFQSADIKSYLDGAERIIVVPILLGEADSGEKAYSCDDQYGITITLD